MAGVVMIDVTDIELPYIEKNRSRHGTYRYYFRAGGERHCRLPDDLHSEQFQLAYWTARRLYERTLEATATAEARTPTSLPTVVKPGTFHALTVAYLESGPYKELDSSTQLKRRQIIESMLLEPVRKVDGSPIFASMPMQHLDVPNLEVLRDRKAATPFAADERVKILVQIMDTQRIGPDGRPAPILPINFAKLVKRFRKKTEGHKTIRAEELAAYIRFHGIKSKAVLAVILMMFTGFRVSDTAIVGPQHRRGDVITLRLFKNRNRAPVVLTVPVHPILDLVLSWHPGKRMTYLTTDHSGSAFSVKGLSVRVSKWFRQADLAFTAHTVRKGLATELSESEATESMLDGLFGWKDGKTAKIYTAKKEQAKLARQALQRINWEGMDEFFPAPEGDAGGGFQEQTATPDLPYSGSELPHLKKSAGNSAG